MTKTLEEMIVIAQRREDLDDHLTNKERKAIVEAFIARYSEEPYVMSYFPLAGSMNDQYLYIIGDF